MSNEAALKPPVSDLDLYADEVQGNIFPYLEEIRRLAPVVYLSKYEVYYSATHEIVRAGLNNAGAFSSATGIGLIDFNTMSRPRSAKPRAALPFMDPPDHTPLRNILLKILAPAAMKRMQQFADGWAERLVDFAIERGEVDLVQDIVRPFTVNVMADAVGLPDEGRDNLITLGNVTLASVGPLNERYQDAMSAAVSSDTFSWMVEACKRHNLTEGRIGQDIFAAVDRGEIDEGIGEELVSLFVNGGVDTTFTTLSKGFKNFLDNPDQWEALIDEPALARKAFEEVMRYNVSVQQTFRLATRDIELDGYLIPKGARIGFAVAGAGRDPVKFPEPDKFDIRRSTVGHLGFGSGIHSCAGQAVARMEGESLYGAFARRGCRFKLAGEPKIWVLGGMGSWQSLPVKITGRAAHAE